MPKCPGGERPSKPYADFPLFPHRCGQWAKKIRGRLVYFGPWRDWREALERYQRERDDLHAGRTPRPHIDDGLSLLDLCDAFMAAKDDLRANGELAERTFREYHATCLRMLRLFGREACAGGLAPVDFDRLRADIAKRWGLVRLGNEIGRVRSVFRFGYESGLLAQPIRFGPTFRKPSARSLRADRNARESRMLTPGELRLVLSVAPPVFVAMTYLGINCGFGNADCGTLTFANLDLDRGWHRHPRPKTGIERRCPLWVQTVAAIRRWLAVRPEPRRDEWADLVFLTGGGGPWYSTTLGSPVSKRYGIFLKRCGVEREGVNFYALRHTFETVAGDTGDQVAVDYIMGHVPHAGDMSAVYRQAIFDHRLEAVVNRVRTWLLSPAVEESPLDARRRTPGG